MVDESARDLPMGVIKAIWPDTNKQPWSLEANADRILLQQEERKIEIARKQWDRDVYVAEYGSGYIVRFQTFDDEVGFLLEADQASDFIRLVSEDVSKADDRIRNEVDTLPADAPLIWPRVSSLAVWALICSSLTFVPVIGLAPALATVILLTLHRKKVRKSRAMVHSRGICRIAVAFLVLGLCVSGITSANMVRSILNDPEWQFDSVGTSDVEIQNASQQASVASEEPTIDRVSSSDDLLGQSFLEEDHDWLLIAAGLFVVLFSLSVHECAHAITAWWSGDDYARQAGRVTLDPRVHIDPFGTIILPLILALSGLGTFGWAKPVPVRPWQFRSPRLQDVLVSLAGPGSNLLIAAVSFALLLGMAGLVSLTCPNADLTACSAFGIGERIQVSGFAMAPVFGPVATMLRLSFLINLSLAFFNLIPLPPLDGSHVLAQAFPNSVGVLYQRLGPWSFIIFILLLNSGLLYYLIHLVMLVVIPAEILLAWNSAGVLA